ncbi:hypothetical protein HMPREF0027_1363 [Actinobacillus ureae ATCC 25976]|uniref:Uncharacterized protein n=1 Tax=Actinobacillus ureae ATCC 25976 TaxID=887324 RepID=E8KHP6_9PAST|nr:hypothetical protein HMPREF0027_1363 [Actinobacillus ureae ATCC 25976]
MILGIIWLFYSLFLYLYFATYYLFLAVFGQYISVSFITWIFVIYLFLACRKQLQWWKIKLSLVLYIYFTGIFIHLVQFSIITFCYPGHEIFSYDWKNFGLGLIGIPIGWLVYKRSKK